MLAIGFERMRQNAARLQIKFVESNRHRAELAENNLALSQEIRRREAIEADLQRQREALDKSNSELRIAAAAFNSQEGMIVTDTKGVVLSANRAFVGLTGYTIEELLDKPRDCSGLIGVMANSTAVCGVPFKQLAAGKVI